MNHESRILQDMLIAGKMDVHEFKECIDAIKPDTYMGLAEKFMKGKISEMEYVERYNRLIEEEPQPFGPPGPHEHI